MNNPSVTDRAAWETLTLSIGTIDKPDLCGLIRIASERVSSVKGSQQAVRAARKAAEERLTETLDNLAADCTIENARKVVTAHENVRESSADLASLEYHFLEVFLGSAKVALAKHGLAVSLNSKTGAPTFKPLKA